LGGAIAGGVGLLIAFYQEKRKTNKELKNLLAEMDQNIELVHEYMMQVHKGDMGTLDTLHTTAYTIANSTGALTSLPKDKFRDISYAYNKILIFQNHNERDKRALAKRSFVEETVKSLEKARKALKSTLDKSLWVFRRIS